jgi:hypothetical protein
VDKFYRSRYLNQDASSIKSNEGGIPVNYTYSESGLDDVVLLSGFDMAETNYGLGVSIHEALVLHSVLARLVLRRREIDGASLRYLRIEMDADFPDFSRLCGVEESILRGFEGKKREYISHDVANAVRAAVAKALGLSSIGDPDMDGGQVLCRHIDGKWTVIGHADGRPTTLTEDE